MGLSLLAGLCTEELRSFLWSDVDLEAGRLAVYRSVRASGDTKTPKSRRVLKLPAKAVEALRDHRSQQAATRLKAGPLWQDHGLVFASAVGTPLDAHNVRRSFRAITKAAGLGSASARAPHPDDLAAAVKRDGQASNSSTAAFRLASAAR
jgi:integrase